MTDATRFWSKVAKSPGCWEWTGRRDSWGYGKTGRSARTHRVAWELSHGAIPPGLSVLHRCDNAACVNPEHLYLGTQADNMRDLRERRRMPSARKTACVHGHPFDEANTYWRPVGQRDCRACGVIRARRYRAKKAAA